jgi:hypothetical protein
VKKMALPESRETPRGRYLLDIVNKATAEALIEWPMPTKDDLVLIGSVIVLYSYIDFNLRRFIEVLERAKVLPEKWQGKTATMPIGDVETIIQAMPDWAPTNLLAFERIKELRKMRNLMAHFAVRRFPDHDAFVFVTKSAPDFRRVLGYEPEPGMAMTGVVDVGQVRDVIKVIDGLQSWLSQATRQVEDHYFRGAPWERLPFWTVRAGV